MKTLPTILITLAIAIPATWLALSSFHHPPQSTHTKKDKILYYQSAMHPWVKSDKPGKCTICGMDLTPVFEGQAGFETDAGILTLSQDAVRVLRVETTTAQVSPLIKTQTFGGVVDDDARQHRLISAQVDGRIEKLFINHHGTEIEAGKALAEIFSPKLLQAEQEYRTASGEIRHSAAVRLRQLGLTPEQITALPEKSPDTLKTEILSPISGTVVNDEIYAGQYVTEGQKLFEIADFSTMWFIFPAYEQDIPWLRVGQSAEITTPSVPGKIFPGTITFIDPNFDPVTRTTQVRINLPNPLLNGRRTLLHRLYGDVIVKLDAPEVLAIPRTAIIETGENPVVYVEKSEGSYLRKPVKLGRRGDSLVEILSGLKIGDKVVSNGTLLIDSQAEMNRIFSTSPAAEEKIHETHP